MIEIKQSKRFFVLGLIAALIFEIISIGSLIFSIVYSLKATANDDLFGYIFCACFCGIMLIVFLVMIIKITITFNVQKDVFLENKMYRKRGEKIIFEISYDNVIEINRGIDSVFFVLKEPIKRLDGKEAPKNFYEHYAQCDIDKIVQIIGRKIALN